MVESHWASSPVKTSVTGGRTVEYGCEPSTDSGEMMDPPGTGVVHSAVQSRFGGQSRGRTWVAGVVQVTLSCKGVRSRPATLDRRSLRLPMDALLGSAPLMSLIHCSRIQKGAPIFVLEAEHTLNVHGRCRFRQRVQDTGLGEESSSTTLAQRIASHATRDRRQSSQLENCIRRVAMPPCMA